ncbi:Expansin-B18 [Camellia lanceoleosa]|uniref:Expansin-B18 n=1 Tax=Camellia lanceoleosa TaxID=1840588 RepID=A0ACC0IRN9_9ERIC|nr:Expansin-B18 [Camellia lanceoleosa]
MENLMVLGPLGVLVDTPVFLETLHSIKWYQLEAMFYSNQAGDVVKCTSNPACSGFPVTVTISDLCPGSCGAYQFDLSGAAFGAMAIRGRENELRNVGRVQIQYQRVPCHYTGFNLAFRVDSGSNPFFFATAIEYENGDGDLSRVELQNGASGHWLPMQRSFGAVWKLNAAMPGPLSFRITSSSGKTVVVTNVIPVGWKPVDILFPCKFLMI